MEFPLEYKAILESDLTNIPLSELRDTFETIMNRYKFDSGKGNSLINNELEAKVYGAYRLPSTFKAVSEALNHCLEIYNDDFKSLIDVGAGLGAASLAINLALPSINKATLLENNKYMMGVGNNLISSTRLNEKFQYINYDLSKDNLDIKSDLVISSYVLNELDQNSRINAINKMWNMTDKMMLIIEPGTPEGFALIREIRDYLISMGAHVIAPCTHMGVCLNTWCHFSTRVSRSKLHKDIKGGDAPYEDEKYSYVAFSKSEVIPCKNRILRHPQINPGFIELDVCSKDGFKKIKYSKKDKELFKKARKSDAGDQI